MPTREIKKRGSTNAANLPQIAILSFAAALLFTGITSFLFAQIMTTRKMPLSTAVPMASISVGAGSFCAGILQGKLIPQKSMPLSVLTAAFIAILCALAGIPSWQPPYITAVGIARAAVIFLAAVMGNQIGENLKAASRRTKQKRHR